MRLAAIMASASPSRNALMALFMANAHSSMGNSAMKANLYSTAIYAAAVSGPYAAITGASNNNIAPFYCLAIA